MKKLSNLLLLPFLCVSCSSGMFGGASDPTSIATEHSVKQEINQTQEAIEYLLKTGLDVKAPPSLPGNVGLLAMATLSHVDMDLLKKLIDLGIDVNHIDDEGCTPIGMTVTCVCLYPEDPYYMEVAKLLIQHGANPNIQSDATTQPSLHLCAANNKEELLQHLLENGADPNIPDNAHHATALHHAIVANAPLTIIEKLIAKGANPNIRCDFESMPEVASALHLAIYQIAEPSIIQALLKAKADPNALLGSTNASPLAVAITAAKSKGTHENTIATVKLLLEHGADLAVQHGSILQIAKETLGEDHPITTLLQDQ